MGLSKHINMYLSYILLILVNCIKSDLTRNELILQVRFLNWLNTVMSLEIEVQICNYNTCGILTIIVKYENIFNLSLTEDNL